MSMECVSAGAGADNPPNISPFSHTVEIDGEVIRGFIKKMSPKPVWGKMRSEMIQVGEPPE